MITVLAVSASFLLLSCGVQRHDTISFPSNDANSSDNNHSSMQVIKRTLDNGLTVYLSPNHEEPRFYAEIITRAEANMIPPPTPVWPITSNICFSKELRLSEP